MSRNNNGYTILGYMGYATKAEAQEEINTMYKGVDGVTTYFLDGEWWVAMK